MSDYTPTPFQVTVTPVDEKRCVSQDEQCIYRDIFNAQVWCIPFGEKCNDERLPECLAAERAAKEQQP